MITLDVRIEGEMILKELHVSLYEGIVKKLKNQEQHSQLLREIFEVMSEASDVDEASTRIKDMLLKKIDQIVGVM